MAGIWNSSNTQLVDANGKPLVAARAYFYLGGTTTPITVYKAYSLGAVNAHPNPLLTDGYGRWPSVYLDEADGFFRVRVTTAQGVVIYDIDGLPIIGPAGGGGGGGDNPVDPNSVMATGDMMARYGEGLRPGFVRANGRTIGSATSGATERANSDAQALFEHLWNADPNLVVVGGRGGSSIADWSANKQMTLPDFRGRAPVGLDVMGNIAANVLPDATALGWKGGERQHVLTQAEMPSHTHGGSIGANGGHSHTVPAQSPTNSGGAYGSGSGFNSSIPTSSVPDHTHSLTINSTGGGGAHNNIQPSLALTFYVRL